MQQECPECGGPVDEDQDMCGDCADEATEQQAAETDEDGDDD
jgi:NMD protein affecting ribosome stability and mRNA decay